MIPPNSEDLWNAANDLVDALDRVAPLLIGIFATQQIRTGVHYSGPTYDKELNALRAALIQYKQRDIR